MNIFKASALLNGRKEVDLSDLFITIHTAWRNYTDKRKLREIIWRNMFNIEEYYKKKLLEMITEYERLYSIYKVNLVVFVNGEWSLMYLNQRTIKSLKPPIILLQLCIKYKGN